MLMRVYRLSHWLQRHRVPLAPRVLYVMSRLIFSATVPPTATIGRSVVLGYQGLGIVIHKRAVIGDRVVVGPGVTIGGRSGIHQVPVIGDDVMIGAGARILGPVTIGKGAQIGANAVVLIDVPPGATAVGVPARIIAANRRRDPPALVE